MPPEAVSTHSGKLDVYKRQAVDFVSEVPLLPEMTLPEYLGKVKAEVEKLPEGSIILTDVFGGTTTNVGAKLGRDFHIKVYSGLNAPMLLEACSQITFTGTVNCDAVLQSGKAVSYTHLLI